jgi:hypothetical protein
MITPSPPEPGTNPANVRLSMSICGNPAGMRKPSKTDVVFDKEKDPLLLQGNIFFN